MLRERAEALLEKMKGRRILVVGDLMLDRYILGGVTRISPEAPVPVVHVESERSVPGGASNVALNVTALGGVGSVAGMVGTDRDGDELLEQLRLRGIETGAVLRDAEHRTTVKTRILAERQQVVRVDWEDAYTYSGEAFERFQAGLRKEIAAADGVVIEDYGKGVITPQVAQTTLSIANEKGVPVGLDPKDNHELGLRGITLATPNRKEAFIAAGLPESRPVDPPLQDVRLLKVADKLFEHMSPAMLLITLGAQGMLMVRAGSSPVHVPTRAREVFDVSGAGDTVIATCLLAIAAGASFIEAAEIANYAAGVVVGKLGTATCSPDEILKALP